MEGFKTLRRSDIAVSGGDRVAIPALTLEVGGAAETVNVSAEAPLVQSQSGERSFAVTTEQIENLPIGHGNFTNLTAFTPGVISGGASAGGTRLGGVGQNNIMMDGVSAMDTGNNGQMLNMNIESIGEVKILTQGYQAEYGRSSGLQITAVTKSGTNRYRGSVYDLQTDSDWNANSWVRDKNGDVKPKTSAKTLGYTLGGPVGKPGGANKLFFFYAHEYRPTTTAINNGNPIRLRVPTALERNGDFSQSLDNNGALIPQPARPGDAAAVREQHHSGGSPVYPRHEHPEALSASERHPERRHQLQLRGPAADRRQPHAAAGPSARLSVEFEAALHRQVLRRARAQADHARTDPGIHGRADSVSLHHQLRGDDELHDEPDDVRRGHVRVHPQRAGRRQ